MSQLYTTSFIKPKTKKTWSADEDSHLLRLVKEYGGVNWAKIAEGLMNRTGKQCRERYHNHLKPNVRKGEWTEEEDELIIKMQAELGNQWAKITKMLPGRTDNAVKNRWHAAVKSYSKSTESSPPTANIVVPKIQLESVMENTSMRQRMVPPIPNLNINALNNNMPLKSGDNANLHNPDMTLWSLDVDCALAHDHSHYHVPSSARTCSFSPADKKVETENIQIKELAKPLDTARSTLSMLSNLSDFIDDLADNLTDHSWTDNDDEFQQGLAVFVFTPRTPRSPGVLLSPRKISSVEGLSLKRTPRNAFSPDERIIKKARRMSTEGNLDPSIFSISKLDSIRHSACSAT